MYITLSELKSHLNLDNDFKADDQILLVYEQAAEAQAEAHLNRKLKDCLVDGRLPKNIEVGILMLAGHFYNSREAVTYSSAQELPLGVRYLWDAVKYWNIP